MRKNIIYKYMNNLTVVKLKQKCKSLNIKLKKDLIKSISSDSNQSIVGGRKQRSRKSSKKRRRSKTCKRSIKKRTRKRCSRKQGGSTLTFVEYTAKLKALEKSKTNFNQKFKPPLSIPYQTKLTEIHLKIAQLKNDNYNNELSRLNTEIKNLQGQLRDLQNRFNSQKKSLKGKSNSPDYDSNLKLLKDSFNNKDIALRKQINKNIKEIKKIRKNPKIFMKSVIKQTQILQILKM